MKSKSKEALWSRRIRAFEASGQSRTMYCRSRSLKLGTFDYWRRRLSSPSSATQSPAFVPLQVRSAAPTTEGLLLECGDGVRLKLPRDCDPAWLAQMLSALR